ncbi:MAG: ankyrin repeat domain-containing protein, partial [Gammaproteobacteria bacterium]
QAAENKPTEVAQAYLVHGMTNLDSLELNKAREILEKAKNKFEVIFSSDHPEVAKTLLVLGIVDYIDAKIESAYDYFSKSRTTFEKFLSSSHPRLSRIIFWQYLCTLKQGKKSDSKRYYLEYKNRFLDYQGSAFSLRQALPSLGQHLSNDELRRIDNSFDEDETLGNVRYIQENRTQLLNDAETVFFKTQVSNPNAKAIFLAKGYFIRSLVEHVCENYDEAREDFKNSYECLKPEASSPDVFIKVYGLLVLALFVPVPLERLIEKFKKTIEKHAYQKRPNDAWFYHNYACLCYVHAKRLEEMGDSKASDYYKDAEENFQIALKCTQGQAQATLVEYANFFLQQGELTKAIIQLDTACALSSGPVVIHTAIDALNQEKPIKDLVKYGVVVISAKIYAYYLKLICLIKSAAGLNKCLEVMSSFEETVRTNPTGVHYYLLSNAHWQLSKIYSETSFPNNRDYLIRSKECFERNGGDVPKRIKKILEGKSIPQMVFRVRARSSPITSRRSLEVIRKSPNSLAKTTPDFSSHEKLRSFNSKIDKISNELSSWTLSFSNENQNIIITHDKYMCTLDLFILKDFLLIIKRSLIQTFPGIFDHLINIQITTATVNTIYAKELYEFLKRSDLGKQSFDNVKDVLSAVKDKNFELVRGLIEGEPRLLDARDEERNTLLMLAAERNDCATVHYLLSRGINSEMQSSNGDTALIKAVCRGHISTVKLLTSKAILDDAPFLLSLRNNNGFTAFLSACCFPESTVEIVSHLLSLDSSIYEQIVDRENSDRHRNGLMLAIVHQKSDIAEFLLREVYRNDLDTLKLDKQKDANWNTALHLAVQYYHPKLIEILLRDHKVDHKLKNHNNQSALEFLDSPNNKELKDKKDRIRKIFYDHTQNNNTTLNPIVAAAMLNALDTKTFLQTHTTPIARFQSLARLRVSESEPYCAWRDLLQHFVLSVDSASKDHETFVNALIKSRDELDRDFYYLALQSIFGDNGKEKPEKRFNYKIDWGNMGVNSDATAHKLVYRKLQILGKESDLDGKILLVLAVKSPGSRDLISDIDTSIEVMFCDEGLRGKIKPISGLTIPAQGDLSMVIQALVVHYFNQLNMDRVGLTGALSRDSNAYAKDSYMVLTSELNQTQHTYRQQIKFLKSYLLTEELLSGLEASDKSAYVKYTKRDFYAGESNQYTGEVTGDYKQKKETLELAASLFSIREYCGDDEGGKKEWKKFSDHFKQYNFGNDNQNRVNFRKIMKGALIRVDKWYQDYKQSLSRSIQTDPGLSKNQQEDQWIQAKNKLYVEKLLLVAQAQATVDQSNQFAVLRNKILNSKKQLSEVVNKIEQLEASKANLPAVVVQVIDAAIQQAKTEEKIPALDAYKRVLNDYVKSLQKYSQGLNELQQAQIEASLYAHEAYVNFSALCDTVYREQSVQNLSIKKHVILCSILQQIGSYLLHGKHYKQHFADNVQDKNQQVRIAGEMLYRTAKYLARIADCFDGQPSNRLLFDSNFAQLLNQGCLLIKNVKKSSSIKPHQKSEVALLIAFKQYLIDRENKRYPA